MNRIIKQLIYSALCFFAVLFCLSLKPAGQKNKAPNIIYILADDLGYGDVSINWI